MPIEFSCPSCHTTLRVPEAHAGKKAKCPHCQSVVVVQAGPPQASAPVKQQMPPSGLDPSTGQNPYLDSANQYSGPANPYNTPSHHPGMQPSHVAPHRGGLILTLGILSLMCNILLIPGILAWVMGRSDCQQIEAGLMDPEGHGITKAGTILGIIGTCLPLAILAIYICFILFFVLIMAAGAAGAAIAM